jgi:hypothetical protein
MGIRPYDPALGRFIAVDPIEGGSLNTYDYASQDPINNYDLTGTICFDPFDPACWATDAVTVGISSTAGLGAVIVIGIPLVLAGDSQQPPSESIARNLPDMEIIFLVDRTRLLLGKDGSNGTIL